MMCFTLPVLVILMALGTVSRAEDPCHIWGTDIPGDDIRYINNMKDLSQCRLKCSEEKSCTKVVYYPEHVWPKGKRCFLKKAGDGERKSNKHAHLAVLPCPELFTYCPSGQKVGSDYKTCVGCPENTRSDGGRISSCPKCPAGTRTYNTPSGVKVNECIPCPAGQFGASPGAGCSTCPDNTYSGRAGATSCTPCPAGKFSSSGAHFCSPCPSGQYGSSSGAGCSQCPANTYSSEGQTKCTPCKNGLSSISGSKSVESCLEPVEGVNCWKITAGSSENTLGSQNDALSFEEVYISCHSDKDCQGVKCKREREELTNFFFGDIRCEHSGRMCLFRKS